MFPKLYGSRHDRLGQEASEPVRVYENRFAADIGRKRVASAWFSGGAMGTMSGMTVRAAIGPCGSAVLAVPKEPLADDRRKRFAAIVVERAQFSSSGWFCSSPSSSGTSR